MIAFFFILSPINMIAQTDLTYKTAVDIQNITIKDIPHKKSIENKFDSVLLIQNNGEINSITAKASVIIPKNMHVVDLYIEGYQAGMKSIVDAITSKRCKIISTNNSLQGLITISCDVDKDTILFGEHGDAMACKFKIKMIIHAGKKDFIHQQDVKVVLKKKSGNQADIYLQGYFKGANLVLQFVSSASLQIVYA